METSREIRVDAATTCPGAAARDNYRFCVFIIMERAQNAGLFQGVGLIPCVAIRVCLQMRANRPFRIGKVLTAVFVRELEIV